MILYKEQKELKKELVEALKYKDLGLELARKVIQIDQLKQQGDALEDHHKTLQKEHGVLLKKLDELDPAYIPF